MPAIKHDDILHLMLSLSPSSSEGDWLLRTLNPGTSRKLLLAALVDLGCIPAAWPLLGICSNISGVGDDLVLECRLGCGHGCRHRCEFGCEFGCGLDGSPNGRSDGGLSSMFSSGLSNGYSGIIIAVAIVDFVNV